MGWSSMTPEVAVVLLVATLAVIGSTLALLVTYDGSAEGNWATSGSEAEDAEGDCLAWEWRLQMASLPEAYWY